MQEIIVRKDDAVTRNDQDECNACDDLMCKLDDYRKGVREAGKADCQDSVLREAFIKYLCTLSSKTE